MLRQDINDAMKQAMRDKDQVALGTIRLINAAMKDRDIAARAKGNADGIDEGEITSLLQSMIKQRRESIDMYDKGGRAELAEREGAEIAVIERFLPEQMDDAAVEAAVAATIEENGAEGLKDMGGVMATLREKYAGQMDFAKAGAFAKKALGG